jgi:hypothetical protein
VSNCITLSGHSTKILGRKDIDIDALKRLCDSVRDLHDAPSGFGDGYIAWWFLSRATFRDGNTFVTIPFGQDRSTHTFRDLRATLHLLSKFAKRPVRLNFRVKDPDMNWSGKLQFMLVPGKAMEL